MEVRSTVLWLLSCCLIYTLTTGAIVLLLTFSEVTDTLATGVAVLGGLSLFASLVITGVLLPANLIDPLDSRGMSMLNWGSITLVADTGSLLTIGLLEVLLYGALGGTVALAILFMSWLMQKL